MLRVIITRVMGMGVIWVFSNKRENVSDETREMESKAETEMLKI